MTVVGPIVERDAGTGQWVATHPGWRIVTVGDTPEEALGHFWQSAKWLLLYCSERSLPIPDGLAEFVLRGSELR